MGCNTRLLESAASEITSDVHRQGFASFIDHNELELALDVLENAAAGQEVSVEFWWHVKKAAEVMGLAERRKSLQVKYQEHRRTLQHR